MQDKHVTITGLQHYYGTKPFNIGSYVVLTKDFDNEYDSEAIRVELPYIGKVGYVANSAHTVAKGTYSAGRLYDTFSKKCYGKIMFVHNNSVIVKVEYEMPMEFKKIIIQRPQTIYDTMGLLNK